MHSSGTGVAWKNIGIAKLGLLVLMPPLDRLEAVSYVNSYSDDIKILVCLCHLPATQPVDWICSSKVMSIARRKLSDKAVL